MTENLAIFLLIAGVVIAALLLYVAYRTGWDLAAFREHWRTSGKGAPAGIVGAVLFVVIVAFLIWSTRAEAGEWFEYTEVYAGVEATFEPSPQCEVNAVDDRLTSNIGVRQHIVRHGAVSVLANFTHHSCAIGSDAASYNAVGLQATWRFDR